MRAAKRREESKTFMRSQERFVMSEGRMPLRAALAAVLAATAVSSHAEQGDPVENVVVTGSRIKRQDLKSVGPVTVLNASDIAARGITSTDVLLQELPASAGFAGNQTSAYWIGAGWGTAQVNLRGLGANRTLVLLNGRRLVYGGSGANSSVDLNLIPTSLIERIEVLKDGASALYGADAVAGVVNIVTREQFDGLSFDTKYGQTSEGDGEEVAVTSRWVSAVNAAV